MRKGSDIEETMKNILLHYFESTNAEESSKIKAYIFEKVVEKNAECAIALNRLEENGDIMGLINNTLFFDSLAKAKGIQQLAKQLKISELGNFCKTYTTNVSSKRNKLGHVKGEVIDGVTVFMSSSGDIPIKIDETFCTALRQDITKHKTLLKKLQNQVNQRNGEADSEDLQA